LHGRDEDIWGEPELGSTATTSHSMLRGEYNHYGKKQSIGKGYWPISFKRHHDRMRCAVLTSHFRRVVFFSLTIALALVGNLSRHIIWDVEEIGTGEHFNFVSDDLLD